jgi:isocitrate dehydrogenase kinase/phosphatase
MHWFLTLSARSQMRHSYSHYFANVSYSQFKELITSRLAAGRVMLVFSVPANSIVFKIAHFQF